MDLPTARGPAGPPSSFVQQNSALLDAQTKLLKVEQNFAAYRAKLAEKITAYNKCGFNNIKEVVQKQLPFMKKMKHTLEKFKVSAKKQQAILGMENKPAQILKVHRGR